MPSSYIIITLMKGNHHGPPPIHHHHHRRRRRRRRQRNRHHFTKLVLSLFVIIMTGWLDWYSVGLNIQRTEVRFPPGIQQIFGEIFRVENVLTRWRCAQPPVRVRTHKNEHVRTLKIP